MKYAVLFIILLPCALSAQFVKGHKYIGGSVSFTTHRIISNPNVINENHSNSFTLSPEFGIFINKNLAIGSEIQLSHQLNRNILSDGSHFDNKSTGYGLSIFAKKYYPVIDQFSFALKGNLKYSRSNHTNDDVDMKFHSIGAAISPSFTFFPTPNWGIEAVIGGLSYSVNKHVGSGNAGHNLSLKAGLLSFGFQYFIRSTE